MKTMICKQLGGACDKKFQANTFEEMQCLSKEHGVKMYQKGDKDHLKAMSEIQEMMKSPGEMTKWFENKKNEFNKLPNS